MLTQHTDVYGHHQALLASFDGIIYEKKETTVKSLI